MRKYLLLIVLFFCLIQQLFPQENEVVSFAMPVRNSLKFNKYIINPTFSFVREQNRYVSFYNKRQWVEFDDAPQTYLFSYSGRFRENIGIGAGLFQQNYGVMTTFGGVLNFAYNAVLDRDNNLTFGMNAAFYKSGINKGKVITNSPDPLLDNIPSSTLISINPGINYGTLFFDFGVSINNLVLYNLKASEIIKEDPEKSIQAHVMYTGYMDGRGFFDEAKFSGLIKSEFKKDKTIVSGLLMLAVPKGIWAQAGYNSLYGVFGGVGLNISSQISIEYNFEKAIGDLSAFGSSHEVTLAYKIQNRDRYIYSGDDEEQALIAPTKKGRRVVAKQKTSTKPKVNAVELAKTKAEERARLQQEAQAKKKAEEEARAKAAEEARLQQEASAKAKAEEQARLKREAEARAKAAEEARLKQEVEAKAKAEEQARLKQEAEARAKAAEEARLQQEVEAKAKVEEQARLKQEAEARAKAAEEARLLQEAEAKARAEEDAMLKQEAEKANAIVVPEDNNTKAINNITRLAEESRKAQEQLLTTLSEKIAIKEQDLKDLKEENDLSEKGIYVQPKPFKSVSAENAAIESLKVDIDNAIKERNNRISELENLYRERLKTVPNKKDATNVAYQETINVLKAEQAQALQAKENLFVELEKIKVATEIERKRRIKRAAYDNENDKYLKDRASLTNIKQTTQVSSIPLTAEDFDFGEQRDNKIVIIKDVKNVESGYYLILAVHTDVAKRDAFLSKVVSTGRMNIDFFYDVNSSKYFIYYQKFDSVEEANTAMQNKGNEPYNNNMSLVKVEN